jgi:large subunit ribosomal protein L21
MKYAVIALGGKQYRVREGERLLVDRLPQDEGKTFALEPLLTGGDGDAELAPKGVAVTARVVGHVLGEKIRIGKYKPKKGYRRHTGYRSRLSRIEIESIGPSRSAKARKTAETDTAQTTPDTPAKASSARSRPKASASRGDEG